LKNVSITVAAGVEFEVSATAGGRTLLVKGSDRSLSPTIFFTLRQPLNLELIVV
jgi:hypothetical protein